MNLPIIDKLQEQARTAQDRTREQLERQLERTREQFKELQDRGQGLLDRNAETLKERSQMTRRTITRAEAQALDLVDGWLERLQQATGEKAPWIDKGRSFIHQVAQDVRRGTLTMDDLPIRDYDDLGVKAIALALKDLDPEQRELIRSYEQAHKDRVTVYRAIDRLARTEG